MNVVAQADTVDQVQRGAWKVEQGGPKQASFMIRYAEISTPKGPRRVGLYTTKVAESKSFSVHAAAVCPTQEPGAKSWAVCEETYFGMLDSLGD